MFENVGEHLDEAVRLAERCPEKYQLACFQALIRMLAQHDSPLHLAGNSDAHPFNPNRSTVDIQLPHSNGFDSERMSPYADLASSADRTRDDSERGPKFMDQYQIPEASISRVYHLDGQSYRIIVKDLKEKTSSKKQVKLALLLGIGGLLSGGQPIFSKQKLIEACREYGAYDAPNFASHMKKQRNMFISKGHEWSLTVPAQQRAAEAIKELAV